MGLFVSGLLAGSIAIFDLEGGGGIPHRIAVSLGATRTKTPRKACPHDRLSEFRLVDGALKPPTHTTTLLSWILPEDADDPRGLVLSSTSANCNGRDPSLSKVSQLGLGWQPDRQYVADCGCVSSSELICNKLAPDLFQK